MRIRYFLFPQKSTSLNHIQTMKCEKPKKGEKKAKKKKRVFKQKNRM